MTRHFMIERYPRPLWPQIRGQRPFLVRGRCFTDGYRCAVAFDSLDDSDDSRWAIAEVLLADWTLDAAFAPTDLTPERQTEEAVFQVLRELPRYGYFGPGWSPSVRALLEMTPTLHARELGPFSEDGIKLSYMDVI